MAVSSSGEYFQFIYSDERAEEDIYAPSWTFEYCHLTNLPLFQVLADDVSFRHDLSRGWCSPATEPFLCLQSEHLQCCARETATQIHRFLSVWNLRWRSGISCGARDGQHEYRRYVSSSDRLKKQERIYKQSISWKNKQTRRTSRNGPKLLTNLKDRRTRWWPLVSLDHRPYTDRTSAGRWRDCPLMAMATGHMDERVGNQ